jgi:hypothetical protein
MRIRENRDLRRAPVAVAGDGQARPVSLLCIFAIRRDSRIIEVAVRILQLRRREPAEAAAPEIRREMGRR